MAAGHPSPPDTCALNAVSIISNYDWWHSSSRFTPGTVDGAAERGGGGEGASHWPTEDQSPLSYQQSCLLVQHLSLRRRHRFNKWGCYQVLISPMKDHLNVWVTYTSTFFVTFCVMFCGVSWVFFLHRAQWCLNKTCVSKVRGRKKPLVLKSYNFVCQMCEDYCLWIIWEFRLFEHQKPTTKKTPSFQSLFYLF